MRALHLRPQVTRPPLKPIAFRVDRSPPPRYREIEKCRICGNEKLSPVLSLGEQFLTGVFPRGLHATLSKGPLELVACAATGDRETCGLVQLRQSYELGELYGENYGYRSSLNASMVRHLKSKVQQLLERHSLRPGDLVLDIGSNDGTLLSFYPEKNVTVVGIDPTGRKFASYYRKHIALIPDFFSADLFCKYFGSRKARIVTSISMFYDLESPLSFMQDVASILDEEGVWHFEMSYMPSMVRTMGYDTICHVTVARRSSSHAENSEQVENLLLEEEPMGLSTVTKQREFEKAVDTHKRDLLSLLHTLKAEKRTVLGYGASTKGNVLLQHCGISRDLLPAIAEVNEDKFGCFTPGTSIPIISEAEAHAMKPDYFFVLPWHFRSNIIEREQAFLKRGGKLIFPLPTIGIVGG
jgi:hypothetical protein